MGLMWWPVLLDDYDVNINFKPINATTLEDEPLWAAVTRAASA